MYCVVEKMDGDDEPSQILLSTYVHLAINPCTLSLPPSPFPTAPASRSFFTALDFRDILPT